MKYDETGANSLDALLARSTEDLAVARGRLRLLRERAMYDPELREALRLRAWFRADPAAVQQVGEDDYECPDGWPLGVDGDAVVREHVDEHFGDGAEDEE